MKPDSRRRNTLRIILIIFASILFYVALQNTEKVSAILSYVGAVLTPVIIAIALAFILNIPLKLFEVYAFSALNKKCKKIWPKIRRPLCLLLSVIVAAGVFTLVLLLIIPEMRDTIVAVAEALPGTVTKFADSVTAWLSGHNIPVSETLLIEKIDWANLAKEIISGVGNTGSAVVGFTTGVVGGVFNFVVGFALSIYILAQKEKLKSQAARVCRAALPAKYSRRIIHVCRMSLDTFSHFVMGQLTEALLIGIFCFIGMNIFRMPYAVMVSATLSITALVPVFGPIIGTTVGALMICFTSPIKAIWFVVFIIVLQQLDNNLVYPRVVGESVGLPGIWVLLSVTIAGTLFGAVGMLAGVPVCAVCYNLIREFVAKKEALPQPVTVADPPEPDDTDKN